MKPIPPEKEPNNTAMILTIEAASPGGVPSLVNTIYGLMAEWGYQPVVTHTRFAEGDMALLKRLKITWQNWQPNCVNERGLDTILVAAPPLPLWGFYAVPQYLFGPLLGAQDGVFVVSGSAHVALPLAVRGIPYTLWIATLYEDELQGKATVGDRWAQRVLHSPTWPLLQAQERFVLRRAARILALSYFTADRVRAVVPDAASRVEAVPFPIDTDRFKPDPHVRENAPYGRYLLLAARINDPRKNVGLLLRAYADVREDHPDLKLVLVGEEPDDRVRGLVDDLNIGEGVIFAGIVSSDELLRLYQGAELFVLPSVQEGLGIVVLEALACGTPVVTTACGGPEGIVIDGETGRVVNDHRDEAEMAGAINDLLADPDALAAMREQCATFAGRRFAHPVVTAQLKQGYQDALEANADPPRLRWLMALLWALVVLAAFVQHQFIINWPSFEAQIVRPLLDRAP